MTGGAAESLSLPGKEVLARPKNPTTFAVPMKAVNLLEENQ
jgi:hypothetical protein